MVATHAHTLVYAPCSYSDVRVGEVARSYCRLQCIYCKLSWREMSTNILHGLGHDVFNFRSEHFRGGTEKTHENTQNSLRFVRESIRFHSILFDCPYLLTKEVQLVTFWTEFLYFPLERGERMKGYKGDATKLLPRHEQCPCLSNCTTSSRLYNSCRYF